MEEDIIIIFLGFLVSWTDIERLGQMDKNLLTEVHIEDKPPPSWTNHLHKALDAKVDTRHRTILKTFVGIIPVYKPCKDWIGRYGHAERIHG